MVEIAREVELKIEPRDVTEIYELLLLVQQGEWFLEMKSALGENAVKVVK